MSRAELRELADPRLPRVHPLARPILWTCVLAIAAFVGWAAHAELDEVTRGDGRVVPQSRIQKIQSLEGGIVEQLLVQQGDVVEAGQPLLKLDRTRFGTALDESRAKADALQAAIARLEAEARGLDAPRFPRGVAADGAPAAAERSLFAARRGKLREATRALDDELGIAMHQLQLVEPLVQTRAVSEMEALKLRQTIAALNGKRTELANAFAQDALTELAAKKTELATLQTALPQRADQLRRTVVTSPVKGRVNDIRITTRGGVVQPGEPIMDILPIDEQLLVEARVKPRDVAFLAPGMPARVKITAYDYTVYGDLAGRLEQISADTLEEQTPRGKEAFYRILVRTDSASLRRAGAELPIKPGMVAEVDILGAKRSVLSYLLRPLLKARLS